MAGGDRIPGRVESPRPVERERTIAPHMTWRSRFGCLGGFLATILLIAACSPGPSPAPTATPASTAGPTASPASPTETVAPTAVPTAVRIYLVLGIGEGAGLVPVERLDADPSPTPEAALRLLLAGPNADEAAARPAIYTGIPEGVELRGLTMAGGVAMVDLSSGFEDTTEGELPTSMRIAQVVYTLTRFPGIESVQFEIDGRLVTVIGPPGALFSVDRPLAREDLSDALPPLFVDEPAWGATLVSPVTVTGLANAFEATFELRIADAEGRGVAAGSITASCGTGCWGDFAVDVPFSVQVGGPGLLQVFEESAKDGARINLRQYPVTLTP
jgi:spore germination protein GerM